MRLLIPNDITVSEQFKRMEDFNHQFQQWYLEKFFMIPNLYGRDISVDVVEQFEADSGIRCNTNNYDNRLLSPTIVDERKYIFFTLKYPANSSKLNFKI